MNWYTQKIILVSLLMANLLAYGQEGQNANEEVATEVQTFSEGCPELAFQFVTEMPTYFGGNEQLETDLNKSIKLDDVKTAELLYGFVVDCKGKVREVEATYKQFDNINKQIEAFIITSENWKPGVHRDVKINCKMWVRVKIKKGRIKVK